MNKTIISIGKYTMYRFNNNHWCVTFGKYGKFVKGYEDTDYTTAISLLLNQ